MNKLFYFYIITIILYASIIVALLYEADNNKVRTTDSKNVNISISVNPVYIVEENIVEEVHIDEDELELLARLISAEAGSDWCDDSMLYGVGSVVLNRMNSDYYPSTMEEVIYQEGQYACTWNGAIDKVPTERAYKIAEDLLLNGSTLPENVIFQAQFKQGDGVYIKVQNMYFCYKN